MRAYERLLNYVRVYTTSDPESGTHPSAEREFDLARQLVEEMKALGIEDARVDEHCYVYGLSLIHICTFCNLHNCFHPKQKWNITKSRMLGGGL